MTHLPRRTHIIATLGPASDKETMLKKMFISGLDVVRLNFSHGAHKDHIEKIKLIRALNKKTGRSVKILQDLAGYRIRLGYLKDPIPLKKSSEFYLTQEDCPGNASEVPFDYTGSTKGIKPGNLIYIEDGKIVVKVKQVEKRRLLVKTVVPGILKPRKGINIIGADLDFEALTEKDKVDVQIAISQKLDAVAQSFVREASDIILLREIIKPKHPKCLIFAKVENPEALKNIDEIIAAADGIMVARGDMGICVPIYKVPVIQKIIIAKCRRAYKPVIVATQMLESMTENEIPTRAEVSDVANAITDGASHCMLSGESAVGKHPDKVVAMMKKIIEHTELVQGKVRALFEL
jgi:pyruvate kinase